LRGDRCCGPEPALRLTDRLEQPRVVCRNFDRFNEAALARQRAKLPAHEPVNQPREPPGLCRLDALHESHGSSFLCPSPLTGPCRRLPCTLREPQDMTTSTRC